MNPVKALPQYCSPVSGTAAIPLYKHVLKILAVIIGSNVLFAAYVEPEIQQKLLPKFCCTLW